MTKPEEDRSLGVFGKDRDPSDKKKQKGQLVKAPKPQAPELNQAGLKNEPSMIPLTELLKPEESLALLANLLSST